jgi:hypothetical protein
MTRTLLLFSVVLFTGVACGEKKPAKEPLEESTNTDSPSETKPNESDGTGGSSSGGAASGSGGSSGRSIVNEQAPRSQSSYDKENTEVVLARASRQVKANCGATKDEDGKMLGPWGKATIKVLLGHNGHAKNVTVPAPFDGKPVAKCVANAFSILQFPPWAGSDTEIDWEVELVVPPKK